MKIDHIDCMVNGWFVGDFEPSLFKTEKFEVAYKYYKSGEIHPPHFHKVATEINYISRGTLVINKVVLGVGEFFVLDPHEVANIEFLTDCEIVVVKVPSTKGDKYEKEIDED